MGPTRLTGYDNEAVGTAQPITTWERKMSIKDYILDELQSSRPIQKKDICENWKINEKTFYRYINELNDDLASMPNSIVRTPYNECGEHGLFELKHAVSREDNLRMTPGGAINFGKVNKEEQRALALACQVLARKKKPDRIQHHMGFILTAGDHLNNLLKKISTTCPPLDLDNIIFSDDSKVSGQKQIATLFMAFEAIVAKKPMQITYSPKTTYNAYKGDNPTERIINPVYLEQFNGSWRLRAFCEKAGERRTFNLDSIESCEILMDRSTSGCEAWHNPQSPQKERATAFGPYIDVQGPAERVVVTFSKEVKGQINNLSQQRYQIVDRQETNDDGVKVTFGVNHIYLAEWLPKFIPYIENIEHRELRKKILEDVLETQIKKISTKKRH